MSVSERNRDVYRDASVVEEYAGDGWLCRGEMRSFRELAERAGVIVQPGSFLGEGGRGYIRVALSPTVEQCEAAATAWRRAISLRCASVVRSKLRSCSAA